MKQSPLFNLVVRKKGGGERVLNWDKWYVMVNTPVGEDARYYQKMPWNGQRFLPYNSVLRKEPWKDPEETEEDFYARLSDIWIRAWIDDLKNPRKHNLPDQIRLEKIALLEGVLINRGQSLLWGWEKKNGTEIQA